MSTSLVMEALGLIMVMYAAYKLDGINRALGDLTHFAKTATKELDRLRDTVHKHSNILQVLRYEHDKRAREDQGSTEQEDD